MRLRTALGICWLGLTSAVFGQRVEVFQVRPVPWNEMAPWTRGLAVASFVRYPHPEFIYPASLAAPEVISKGFVVPVYFHKPQVPYQVMGWIVTRGAVIGNEPRNYRKKALADACRCARNRGGADALWLQRPAPGSYLQGLAIKFTSR